MILTTFLYNLTAGGLCSWDYHFLPTAVVLFPVHTGFTTGISANIAFQGWNRGLRAKLMSSQHSGISQFLQRIVILRFKVEGNLC